MSFAKVISLISTMTPTGLGFWGYTWEIIGNFFVWLFTYVVNAFYGVCKWFLAFVDFLQYFIQKLIGLDYWLSPGGKDLTGATESDLLFSFLYNETVQDVFRTLVGLFIVLLIIFTVFAIIRQEWRFVTGTEKDNTKSKILSGSLKAIALVVITPLILVIGIISSNAILASIVKALNIDMSSTFGNTIFSISSVNANKYRIYTDSGTRTPVSQQVTFYINSDEELVLYGSAASDEYQRVYSDYDEYLQEIDRATKYTVDSMFPIVVPSKQKEFYGYCISLNVDGIVKYYMVEVDVDNTSSTESKEKISAMYYYLRNVLRANLMSRFYNIGNSEILKALGSDISSTSSSTPCLISKFNIDGCKSDAVYEACYNTWDYATIYRTSTAFDATTASTVITTLQEDYKIQEQSNAKIMYNAYDYQKYFDGGQFGVVQLNAEYGVMTDVIDFICETGANLYILDATSPLINWTYKGYEIEGKWVSEITGGVPEMYEADDEKYLPFIVDYSETAMDHEEGKTLYLAKADVSNELEGSKFIMCWKVSTDSGIKYVPLLNRETFTDPVTKQTYTFKSTYLSNSYKGLIVAKGNFDQEVSSSVNGPADGDPTYFKVGASLGDGKDAIEYTNEPYYYDISKSGELVQSVSDVQVSPNSENTVTLKNINFDSSSFPNYAMVFDSTDKSLFRFVDTNNNSEIDITTNLINSLTVRFVDSLNKDDSAVYAGVNDGTNYLFVSKSSGRVLMLCLTDLKTLTVRGVVEDGSIIDSSVVPSEIETGANTFKSPSFLYKITLTYGAGANSQNYSINPLDLQLSQTADGKSLFSSIDKYYILVGEVDNPVIKQNMTLCAYFNESSLYNISDGKLVMATRSGHSYDLQMFRVSLYDFMVGYIDNVGIYKYVSSGNNIRLASASDVIETFDFGIVEDGFEWNTDSTEYSVFNGSSYVAKLIKTKGTTFIIDNVAGTNGEDSTSVSIEIDGKTYYNVKTQNKYADKDAMETAYDIINNSMFVGCYRDRATTDFWTFDLNIALNENFRFNLKLNLPVIEKEELMNKTYGVFSLTDGIAFDYFFETGSLLQFYNAYKVAYWIILIASALIIKTLGTALWGVIKRFYEITLYYLAMPVAASTMPLDGGKKFGQIQEGLIKNVLGAYGVILGINMFFVLLSPVKSLSNIFTQAEMDSSSSYFLRHFPFGAKVLNNYVYILFVLVAFTMIDSLPTVINNLVGGKDVVSEGKTTKENVGKAAKSAGDMISGKAAMDFAGKTVNQLSQTPMAAPIKWAVGKVRGGVDNVKKSFNHGASQEDDDAAQNSGNSTQNSRSESSRADGSSETQTDSQNSGEKENKQSGLNETQVGQVQEIVSSMLDGQGNEDGEESANDKNDDSDSDKSEEDSAAAEYNKQAAQGASDSEKAKAVKNMAKEGTNQEITNNLANEIVGDNKELGQNGVGLPIDVIREIIRQMLGEQANGMTDEELDKYQIDLGKDVMGNNIASLKKTNDDGSVDEMQLDNSQISTLNSAIVANASDEQVKQAYDSLDSEQKEEVEDIVAGSVSGVSFAEEVKQEATDEQKVQAVKDLTANSENQEIANAIANEVVGDKKTAEELGLDENEVRNIIREILGDKANGLNDAELDKYKLRFEKDEKGNAQAVVETSDENKQPIIVKADEKQTEDINKQLANKATDEQKLKAVKEFSTVDTNQNVTRAVANEVVGDKKTAEELGLDENEVRNIVREILGDKANGLNDAEIDKYKLHFEKDANGNVQAELRKNLNDGSGYVSVKADEKQTEEINKQLASKATDENYANAYKNLSSETKASVDSYAKENYAGTKKAEVAPENATLANANINALKLIDKYKDDEDVENAVILKTMQMRKNKARLKDFMRESGLSENASQDEMLETIAKMKNSQNVNAAKLTLEEINEKGLTDAHAKVVAEMFASGKIKATAWDLASDAEKQEFKANRKLQNHELTAEEKEFEKELNMQAVRDYEKTDKADYDKHVIEAYVSDNSIENKTELSKNILLAATGLDNVNNLSYKKAAQEIKHAEFSDGNKKFDLAELAKKGYSGEDVMFAYQKMKLLADKDGKIDGKKIHKDNGKLDADLLMKMLEKPDENTSEALTKLTEKDASARQTVSDMLMKGTNGKTPMLTSEQQDGIVSKIAEGDGNGFTFIEKQLSKANNGTDERGTAYKQVVDEANKRKQVENIYATQGSLINAEMLNKASGSENYKALLDQINAMKDKAGEARVTSITDEDLQKLINNEDNVGYDPTELVNLRKEIIRGQIENQKTPEFSKVVDSSSLSAQDKANFEYKKSIIEDQVNAEGDNSETLANLFKNSNFVGKDELQSQIESIVNKMKLNPENKGKSDNELYALAVGQVLKTKNEAELQSEIKSYMKTNGVSKEEAEQAVRQKNQQVENAKDVLYSIAATDITKAISKDNLKEKQLEVVKDDIVLDRQISDLLATENIDNVFDYDVKYQEKLKYLLDNDDSFKARLDDKLQNMIDPSKQVSDEDKENFFRSKAKASDVTGVGESVKNGVVNVKTAFNGWLNSNASDENAGFAKKFGSATWNVTKEGAKNTWIKGKTKIQNFAAENDNNALKMTGAILRTPFVSVAKSGAVQSIVYKVTKSAPKNSEKYNKWNEILDKDIEAVKKGKGVYAEMSKDERKAKIEELKSKKIDSKLPDEYASWDNAKQTAYMQQQILLKNEAFNANFSEIKSKQRAEKPKDKNVILKFADNLGYSAGKVPILGAVTAKFASKELKEKHEQDLAIAAANIDRYKSSAPMRNNSRDFGANFENFAKSYISKNAIEKIQKDIAKKGLTGDKAVKAREEAFAREINNKYKVASAKVARDQGVDKNVFLKEKGINAGSVRYKDGTKRFTQVKSRLNLHIPGVNALVNKAITEKRKNDIIKYEDEYKRTNGNVSEKTRKKYENSYYGKRSEEAAVRSQNEARAQQKLHDDIIEFNKSFKGKSSEYADEFKKKFGDELYNKYNKLFNVGVAGSKIKSANLNLEKSPVIVQQRELIRQLEREMKKNLNRQKYASAYIPASELTAAKFRVEALTNKKTKASIANDRQMAMHYNAALKEFMAQKGNSSFKPETLFNSISPVVREQFESKFNSFKKTIVGFDRLSAEKQKDYLQRFLETQLEKYNKRVVNNSFTPSQLQNLVKLNGTYLDKSKVQNSRISNTVLRSLNATDTDVYKNLVKNVNSARAKVGNETANLENLKQALKEVQTGIQNNAARAEAEKIRKAIANSEIKLNNLKSVLGAEEARKKAFEQAIASDRIKKAIRENSRAAATATPANRPINYRRPDGSPRVVKPGSLDQRQIQELEKKFMAQAKAELDYMAKIMVSKESQKLVGYINSTNKKLTQDAQENIRNLKSIQENIRKELKTLIDKNDKKTKMYKDDLNMQNQKLDNLIKKMTREFAKMDIII